MLILGSEHRGLSLINRKKNIFSTKSLYLLSLFLQLFLKSLYFPVNCSSKTRKNSTLVELVAIGRSRYKELQADVALGMVLMVNLGFFSLLNNSHWEEVSSKL